ncbi:MAG TPA: septum formation initiator family protein [Acidimicrobiales bacterium]|nr:septum formation initiator family protein [Acidimicrobiales bacterium]
MMRRALWPLVVSVVAVAAMFLFVFPTRTYLGQRASLAKESQQVTMLSVQNRQLSQQVALLNTDAEIERLARQDYGLVRPGQEAYAILPAPVAARTGTARPAPARHTVAAPAPDPGFFTRFVHELTFWR